MTQDKEAFLERWSRLKQEKPAEKPPEHAVVQTPDAKEDAAPPLQRLEDLNPDSDFTPFMNPKVDGATRRAALKKLFADARYNIPDPFEAYSEDWTVGEPITTEMLKTLDHARKLLFDEPEKQVEAATAAAVAPKDAASTESPQERDKDPVGQQDT